MRVSKSDHQQVVYDWIYLGANGGAMSLNQS